MSNIISVSLKICWQTKIIALMFCLSVFSKTCFSLNIFLSQKVIHNVHNLWKTFLHDHTKNTRKTKTSQRFSHRFFTKTLPLFFTKFFPSNNNYLTLSSRYTSLKNRFHPQHKLFNFWNNPSRLHYKNTKTAYFNTWILTIKDLEHR